MDKPEGIAKRAAKYFHASSNAIRMIKWLSIVIIIIGWRYHVELGEHDSHRFDIAEGLANRMNLLSSAKVDAVTGAGLTMISEQEHWYRVLQQNRTGIENTTDIYIVQKSDNDGDPICIRLTPSIFSSVSHVDKGRFERIEHDGMRKIYPCPESVLTTLRTGIFIGLSTDYREGGEGQVISAGRIVRIENETLAMMAETDISEIDANSAHYLEEMRFKLLQELVLLSLMCFGLYRLELTKVRNQRVIIQQNKKITKLNNDLKKAIELYTDE